LGICLAVAGAVVTPFYARPWWLTGNPCYPFFASQFTSDGGLIETSRYHHAMGDLAFGVKTLAAFVDAPVLLAFRASNYDGEFGWQLLVLIVLGMVAVVSARRPRMRPLVLWHAVVSLWFYVGWFFTSQQARFAVPALVAFVALASYGLRMFHGSLRNGLLVVLVILSLASVPWRNADYYRISWQTALGTIRRMEYVDIGTRRTYLPLIDAVSAAIPADARLMLLFEHRGFYIPQRHIIGTPLFQPGPFTPPEDFSEPSRILDMLQRDRITHLVVADYRSGPDQVPDSSDRMKVLLNAIAACVVQGRLMQVWESDEYVILAVK
jgi:hypothetical protein